MGLWLSSRDAIGMRSLRNGQLNDELKANCATKKRRTDESKAEDINNNNNNKGKKKKLSKKLKAAAR